MTADLMPDIFSLSAGAPFNPFNRSPMIRYRGGTEHFLFTAAAIWQFQYASIGSNGSTDDYMNFGMAPEVYLGFEYRSKLFNIGIGAEYVYLHPRETAEVIYEENKTTTIKVDDYLSTINAMLYLSLQVNHWAFKAKTVYGQNSSHMLMMSGYGVTKELENGSREYSPLTSSSTWATISYTNKWKIALFGGYMKNLGSIRSYINLDDIYVRGFKNIDQMYRINPTIAYVWKQLEAGIEYELTAVSYGSAQLSGKVTDAKFVYNNRVNAVIIYNF